MNQTFDEKTILVTGGTGSIGTHIVQELLKYRLRNLIIFSRDEVKHFLLKNRFADDRLITVVGDIRDHRTVRRLFEQYPIDMVFHAAAMKHVVVSENFPIECAHTNLDGTQNVVDIAKEFGVPRLITISTDKATSPSNVMGATKLIAEKITTNANYSCVRFGNVANSRGSVIPVFIENLQHRRPIIVTHPDATRFILTIPDAVKLVVKAAVYAHGGEIFILKMNAFRLGDLVEVLVERIAPHLKVPPNEVTLQYIGLTVGEKKHEDLINPTEIERIFEFDDMYVVLKDTRASPQYPGIRPVRLEKYSSNDTTFLSRNEIETIILEYLGMLLQAR